MHHQHLLLSFSDVKFGTRRGVWRLFPGRRIIYFCCCLPSFGVLACFVLSDPLEVLVIPQVAHVLYCTQDVSV